MEPQRKIKVLALADSPTSATGFAQVSRNVLNRLAKTGKYDIDVIGINHSGDPYDQTKFPYRIFQAGNNDMYGRYRFIDALNGKQIKSGMLPPYDLLFTIQDPFVIEGLGLQIAFAEQLRVTKESWKRTLDPEYWFKWIGYFPVDSEVKENWVDRSIALPDYPVAYCPWGLSRIMKFDKENFEISFNMKMSDTGDTKKAKLQIPTLKDRIQTIPHGVDLNVFHVITDEERKKFRDEYFSGQLKDDTFLVVNVSRNQPRKDIARTMNVFAEFKRRVPNSHLYLHMQGHDLGGGIEELGRNFGLEVGKDFSVPIDFNAGIGYTMDIVNKIYNAADAMITTTLGEGWGFISTEAYATKTPLVAPNITSFIDIIGADVEMDKLNDWLKNGGWETVRGIPVLAGVTASEWICLGLQDNERMRPLTNIEDMVNKLVWVKENPEQVKRITDRAYFWVQELTWDKVADTWDKLFMKAFGELEEERKLGTMIDKVGRNEPCPCNSGKKFKHCHGAESNINRMKELIDNGDKK